jgi:hypothetical protein
MPSLQPYDASDLAYLVSDPEYFGQRLEKKQAERKELLQMEPEVAQDLVNQSLGAGQWQPEIRRDIWDDEFIDWYDDPNP